MNDYDHAPDVDATSVEPRLSNVWAKEKLGILACYADGFAKATSRADKGCFIDGFAGPGYNFIRETNELVEGSPLVAMRAGFGRIFLIEKDPEAAASLRLVLAGFKGTAEVIEGDANEEVIRCLQKIPAWMPPLVFLDPTGLQLDWDTVRDIAVGRGKRREKRPELLINFPSDMDLMRKFMIGRTDVLNEERVTAFFGTDEWKKLESVKIRQLGASATAQTRRELLGLYTRRLKEDLGYVHSPQIRDIRVSSSTGRICYYLVFATDDPTGDKIMRHCFRRRGNKQLTMDIRTD